MPETKLKIERTGQAPDADVRLIATVRWNEMNHRVMENMRQQWGRVRGFEEDGVLIAGAIPAVVGLVGRQRPHVMFGPLNAYAWELEEQRDDIIARRKRRNHRNRDEELWLTAEMTAISKLLRELRFASLTADGSLTRAELLSEERLLGSVEFANEQR